MDWSNEPWVKLYTRRTPSWQLLPWEARALFHEMMHGVLDSAGVIDLGEHGIKALAVAVGMPLDVVGPALDALIADGAVEADASRSVVLAPNFVEAQEARASDKERARKSRRRKRDEAASSTALERLSQNVTPQSRGVTEPSRAVTRCHAASRIERREEREEKRETLRRAGAREHTRTREAEQIPGVSGLAWANRFAEKLQRSGVLYDTQLAGGKHRQRWHALPAVLQKAAEMRGESIETVFDRAVDRWLADPWAAEHNFPIGNFFEKFGSLCSPDRAEGAEREAKREKLKLRASAYEQGLEDMRRKGQDTAKTEEQLEGLRAQIRALEG